MSELNLALILTGDNAKLLPAIKQSEQAVDKFTAATQAATETSKRNAKEGDKAADAVKKQAAAVVSFSDTAEAQYAQLEMAVRDYTQSLQANGLVIASNGVVTDKMGKANQKATEKLALLTKAQNSHAGAARRNAGALGNLRGMAQQFGYQVQDVAVQLQMGTNGLMVFGQQGSQLLGALGPAGALAGGVVAVAAALATAFVPSLTESSDKAETLTDKLKDLAKASTLSQAQAAVLIQQENDKIAASKKLIKGYEKEVEKLAQAQRAQEETAKSYWGSASNSKKLAKQMEKTTRKLNEQTSALQLERKAIAEAESRKRIWTATTEKSIKAQEAEKTATENNAKSAIRYQEQLRQALVATSVAQEQLQKQNAGRVAAQLERDLALVRRASSTELQLRQDQYDQQADALENLYIHGKVTQQEFDTWSRKIDEDYARDKERLILQQAGWQGQLLQSLKDSQQGVGDLFDDQVSRFSEGMGQAFETAFFDSENFGDSVGSIFEGMGRSMSAFFGEWAAQRLMMWLLESTLTKASAMQSAQVLDAEAKSTALIAAENAYSSAAKIPYVGWILAPMAGAAAFAATSMFGNQAVSAFAGAFDKGGHIPAGQWGIMSEFGPELYNGVPVMGPATITSREETARMFSGGGDTVQMNIYGGTDPVAIGREVDRRLAKRSKRRDTAISKAAGRGNRNRGLRRNKR